MIQVVIELMLVITPLYIQAFIDLFSIKYEVRAFILVVMYILALIYFINTFKKEIVRDNSKSLMLYITLNFLNKIEEEIEYEESAKEVRVIKTEDSFSLKNIKIIYITNRLIKFYR